MEHFLDLGVPCALCQIRLQLEISYRISERSYIGQAGDGMVRDHDNSAFFRTIHDIFSTACQFISIPIIGFMTIHWVRIRKKREIPDTVHICRRNLVTCHLRYLSSLSVTFSEMTALVSTHFLSFLISSQ